MQCVCLGFCRLCARGSHFSGIGRTKMEGRRRKLNMNIVGKEPTIGEDKTFELVPGLINKHHVDRRRDDKAVDGERHKRDTLDQLQEGLDGD